MLHDVHRLRREETRAQVNAAVDFCGTTIAARIIAARTLLLANDIAGALDMLRELDEAAMSVAQQRLVMLTRTLAAGMIGDFSKAMEGFEDLLGPDTSVTWMLAATELAVSVWAPVEASRWGRRILDHPSAQGYQLIAAAELLSRVRAIEAAVAAARGALERGSKSDYRTRAARIFIRCGLFDDAADLLRQEIAEGTGAGAVDSLIALATLCLWQGRTRAASEYAGRACEFQPHSREARRILAAVELLEGNPQSALLGLEEVVREAPRDPEARMWRAEALMRCGKDMVAIRELRGVRDLTDQESWAAPRIIEAIARLRLGRRPEGDLLLIHAVTSLCGEDAAMKLRRHVRLPWARVMLDRALAAGVHAIGRAGRSMPRIEPPAEIMSSLEKALESLGGNRSPEVTTRHIGGARLQAVEIQPTPRAEVTSALRSVRTGGFEEAYRRLTLLIDRYPNWPHPLFYRAELLMWVARFDDARSDLEAALAIRIQPPVERSRWPLIGLAGVHLLQGRSREALTTIDRAARENPGAPAEPYYAWRGEILRAVGRTTEALATLERVCQPGSCRIGSLIVLALTCQDVGDAQRTRTILAGLFDQAPGLMIEAQTFVPDASSCSSAGSPRTVDALSDDAVRNLLKRALHALRGNRSASCLTFVDANDRLRIIPPNGAYRFYNQSEELNELRRSVDDLFADLRQGEVKGVTRD